MTGYISYNKKGGQNKKENNFVFSYKTTIGCTTTLDK
jgi:hypothetical protein